MPQYNPPCCYKNLIERAQLNALVEYANWCDSASAWTLVDGLHLSDLIINNVYHYWCHGKTSAADIAEDVQNTKDVLDAPEWAEFVEVIYRSAMDCMISECGENEWRDSEEGGPE